MEKALEILRNDNVFDHEYLAWNKYIKIDEAISELEALQSRSCDGCKWIQETKIIKTNIGDRIDICKLCNRYENLQDYFEPKDNA